MAKKKTITIKEIVKQYLEREGYDGLCCEECGCSKNVFYCCEEFDRNCTPARRVPAGGAFADVTADEAAELWRKHKEGHDGKNRQPCSVLH